MLLLLLVLFPLAFSQIDYSQLFQFGNGFPILPRDPRQAGPAAFYRTPLDHPPVARGVPINFNSVIHNVKAGINSVEVYTTTPDPTQAARPRRRHWKRGYSYDAYEGGRSAYPGGYYPEEDGYDDGGYGPPRRPSRPRPRRPPPPRHRRPDDYEGYGRSPPGYESSEGTEGGGGGLFAGGEGTKRDKIKVGHGGKGTISSDSGGLLSSLAKSLDDEGQKKDAAKHGDDEGVPLEDVKDSGQTRAPGFESVTTKSRVGKKKSRSKLHKKKGKGKGKGDEDEEEEEEDENGPLEEVDGEVKVPKTVDGETYDSDEEEEGRKRKRKSKKRKRDKKKHHEEEEDESEDEDKTDESLAEIEDEDEEDCPEEGTTTTTQTALTECEEEDVKARQKKEREKKKQAKTRNKKKSNGERKKAGNKKTCKKKRKCQNKQKHLDKKRETSDESTNERHGRSEPEFEEKIETATNATELISTTTTTKGQGQIVDCAAEKDEFPTKCGPWKAAGYCENNQATQYLWCRRTCLCSPSSRPKRAASWLAFLFN